MRMNANESPTSDMVNAAITLNAPWSPVCVRSTSRSSDRVIAKTPEQGAATQEIARNVAERFAPRVLLADEVGLGKTIEAGMILHAQLQRGLQIYTEVCAACHGKAGRGDGPGHDQSARFGHVATIVG